MNTQNYLGQIKSHYNQTTREIETRIDNSWKKFLSVMEVIKSTELNIEIIQKVFNSCILPYL